MAKVYGNTSGLTSSELRDISRLYRRRIPRQQVITLELGRTLSHISDKHGRGISLLVDRKGRIEVVFIGDSHEVDFDQLLPRARQAKYRLRGYRLLHSHLKNSQLSNSDLITLVNERLDLIGVLGVQNGAPGKFQLAHVLPPNPDGDKWLIRDYNDLGQLDMQFEDFILGLEGEIENSFYDYGGKRDKEGVFLVGFSTEYRSEAEESLGELRALAKSANKNVLGEEIQIRRRIDPRYLIGKGKLNQILLSATQVRADTLIFDVELSPAQVQAIAEETNLRVTDRTQLILEIFEKRARTKEGKIQVKLAQLHYTLPRLTGKGTELSQLGGGIGTRGPGEKKLEEQRRRIRDEITKYENQIEKLSKRRKRTRKRRRDSGIPTATFIGYTNVGKSTIFNKLTESSVTVQNKLFSTLNPTTRRLRLPNGGKILLTDTVGFISDLPEDLVAAFRATLEELGDSSILIHVADSSDPLVEEKIESVDSILRETGYDEIPRVLLFNKTDRVSSKELRRLKNIYKAPFISAMDEKTLPEVLELIENEMIKYISPYEEKKIASYTT